MQKNEAWTTFTKLCTQTKKELQQTPEAFLSPPNQRSKSRYMNVDILIQWGQKVLLFMEQVEIEKNERIIEKLSWIVEYRDFILEWNEMMQVIGITESYIRKNGYFLGGHLELKKLLPNSTIPSVSRMNQNLLNFVLTQAVKVKPCERLVGSSEVIESVLGKQKYLEHEQSKSGLTGLLLGIAAMVGKQTAELISEALEKVSTRQVLDWCKTYLGQTLQGKKMEVFAKPKLE